MKTIRGLAQLGIVGRAGMVFARPKSHPHQETFCRNRMGRPEHFPFQQPIRCALTVIAVAMTVDAWRLPSIAMRWLRVIDSGYVNENDPKIVHVGVGWTSYQ